MASPAESRAPAAVTEELDRDIGLGGAVALGVGTMIAAGIFVLSGLAVSNVGAAAIVAFLLAAVVAAFTAAAYAEFAAIYPESGGGYMYVANVFETDLTYLVGWAMILGYPASAAFYMASFSDWFYRFMYPVLDMSAGIPYWLSGLGVLALLVAVNIKGTKETGLFQVIVTTLKVGLILVFLYGGLQAYDGDVVAASFAENIDNLAEIGLTSALVFITFFGFEAIATNAEEIDDPGTTIPRAIFISMGGVTVIYTLVVLVVVLAVNDVAFLEFLAEKAGLAGPDVARTFVAENGEVSMGRAAQYYLGDVGFYVIIVGALLSMVSAANATVMAGSRVKLAMARRSHLPSAVEEVHDRFRTPFRAVLLTGALILGFILVFTVVFGETPGSRGGHVPFGLHLGIESVAHFADFMLLTGLIFVNVAIVRSRRKDPDLERPFRVPLVPWLPALAVVANLVLLVNVEFVSLVLGLAALAAGGVFWFTWKARPPTVEALEEETPTAVAEYRSPGRDYRLLVALGHPEHVGWLMDTGAALASDAGGEILVMSAVTVPDQTPPSEGRKYADAKRGVLERALAAADESDVPASGIIRIAHDVGDAILNTIRQHEVDAVLLGWHGRSSRRQDLVFGTTVDRILADAGCDVLVEKFSDRDLAETRSILLPVAGGPHTELAVRTAAAVARGVGATVVPAYVVAPDARGPARRRAEALLEDTVRRLGEAETAPRLLEGTDVADALVEEAAAHDLTVIGATREGLLQQLLVGDIPHAVAERVDGPVIMAKRDMGVASKLRRWLRWK
jgi:amino acid transporter